MYELSIPAMSCGHCVRSITAAVNSIDPAASLQFRLDAHTVAVTTTAELATLQTALADAGYPVATAIEVAAAPAHHCEMCG